MKPFRLRVLLLAGFFFPPVFGLLFLAYCLLSLLLTGRIQ